MKKSHLIAISMVIFLLAVSVAHAAEGKGKVLFYADIYEGCDNNVNLDSSRKGDFFTESYAELGYKKPLTNTLSAIIDYYLVTMNYYKITDADFYDNNLLLGLDVNMFGDKVKLGFNNKAEYNYYPNEEISTYISYNPQLSLRHNFTKSTFQRLTYDFAVREYIDRKAQGGTGVAKDKDQQDMLNGLSYELAGLFFKGLFVKVKNQYFTNDSNDQNADYYDYWSYKFNATAIIPLLTERLYGLLSVGYQRIDYGARQLVDDKTKTEKDDLYDISSSLIFDITKRTSLSINYVYRQNESNEPSQEYSGSMVSAGLHYAF